MSDAVKKTIQELVDLEPKAGIRRHKDTKKDFPWKGRACKVYTKMKAGEWKIIFQTGVLNYPLKSAV